MLKACCFEISVNLYMLIYVGWKSNDVKGEVSAVTAVIPAGQKIKIKKGREVHIAAFCLRQELKHWGDNKHTNKHDKIRNMKYQYIVSLHLFSIHSYRNVL